MERIITDLNEITVHRRFNWIKKLFGIRPKNIKIVILKINKQK